MNHMILQTDYALDTNAKQYLGYSQTVVTLVIIYSNLILIMIETTEQVFVKLRYKFRLNNYMRHYEDK